MLKQCGGLLALLAVAACGETTGPELRLDAGLRVVHAAPETQQIEVVVEGETRTRLDYAEVSDRFTIGAGERRLELKIAGETAAFLDLRREFGSGERVTVLAAGRAGDLQPILLVDDPTAADTLFTRIRFVHAAPTAGAVDIYIGEPGDELGEMTPRLTGATFGDASEYAAVESGTYRVRVTAAGTQDIVIDLPLLVLSSTRVATIVAMDTEGSGPPHGLIVLNDRDGRALP